jgi:hypothetical protein
MAAHWRWNWYGSERTTNGPHTSDQVRPSAEEDGEEPDRVEDRQEEKVKASLKVLAAP